MKWKWLFDVYRAQCRMTLSRYLEYRVELHIWLAQIICRPIVFLVVWASAATAMGGTLGGFTPRDFAAYFIVAMLVHHFTLAWMMVEWEPLIKNGDLSYMLLRPSAIVHRYIGENITFKSATMPFMLLTGLGLALAFKPAFNFQAWALAAAVPALLLASVLFFVITWCLGLMSFFTTAIDAIIAAFLFLMLLFSGQMVPISVAPPLLQAIALKLPFWWMIGFPTQLILGQLRPDQAMQGLLMQAVWLAVCLTLSFALWRRGIKTYTAVGI